MSTPRVAPYGTWASPITADLITGGSIGFGDIVLDGGDIYWGELRPAESGRTTIVRRAQDGTISEAIPRKYSARSRVHEYGGGAFAVRNRTIWFCNDADQRIWTVEPGAAPWPLTPEDSARYADFAIDDKRGRLICVCEDHGVAGEPDNRLVTVPFDGGVVPLHRGHDFYSCPRLSPDGRHLAWICWDHPNMPWDGTDLWLADIAQDGKLAEPRRIAGSAEESIFQPNWSPDGVLHFVSDRTGWWNLYRWDPGTDQPVALCPMEAEFGQGYWQFGMATYGFADGSTIVLNWADQGVWRIGRLAPDTGRLDPVDLPYADYYCVQAADGQAAFEATGDATPAALVLLDARSGRHRVLRRSATFDIDPGCIAVAERVTFPSGGGATAHGLLYMPANSGFQAPDGELPPLIVKIHGGPTSQARPGLNLKIQYWTSRGFAVLDVNYRGSTGFGTAYRRQLDGAWGVADVEDCISGATWLAKQGRVDGDRLIITGGSAGGYTTLAALALHDVFRAGASHYGVGDLMALADDTHKFESRYLERLIGPLPAAEPEWRRRSPINHIEGLNCPVVFFQGLDDRVVPPNQAEAMFAALRKKGIPVSYVPFEGEGHGFRKAENIKRALEGELYFYGRVFGFTPAGEIRPIEIENL